MSNLKHWLSLALLPDIVVILGRRLLSIFKSHENILRASYNDLIRIEGIGENRARGIVEFDRSRVDKEIKTAKEKGISIFSIEDEAYPVSVKQFSDAPFVLYVKGEMQ